MTKTYKRALSNTQAAACENAKHPKCRCRCSGALHSKGHAIYQAQEREILDQQKELTSEQIPEIHPRRAAAGGEMIKCIGCQHLYAEVINRLRGSMTVYDCWLGRLPYFTKVSGLLRPAKGITRHAEKCPEEPRSRCVVCQQTTDLRYLGRDDFFVICPEHASAWGEWLNRHPGAAAYMAPRGRMITAHWVELFRDFIEEMRK